MSKLLFQPWMGEKYGTTELGRLLVVGESHYFYHDETDFENFTRKIIKGLGTSSDNDFYIKVGKIFNPENYLDVWSKIAFANAIQHPFDESRQPITADQYKTVEPALLEYLKMTRPTKMLVFSIRVWEKGLPENLSWGNYVEIIKDEKHKKSGSVWKFDYGTGHCYGLGIHHPSSTNPYFRPDEWSPLIKTFLEKTYE